MISLDKNTWAGVRSLLQGIFPTQVSNRGVLHCGQTFYHLNYQEKVQISGAVMSPPKTWFTFPRELFVQSS